MSCSCAKCAAACRHIPGLFTPLEALRAIRAGHATDLMVVGYRPREAGRPRLGRDLRGDDASLPYVVAEGHRPSRPPGQLYGERLLYLLERDNRCEIHDSGFKPVECRLSKLCEPKKGMTDEERLDPWRTAVGRAVIQIWREELRDPAPAARRRVQARRANR